MGFDAVKLSFVKACLQDKLLSLQHYEARVVLNVITILSCPAVMASKATEGRMCLCIFQTPSWKDPYFEMM